MKKILEIQNFLATRFVRLVLAGLRERQARLEYTVLTEYLSRPLEAAHRIGSVRSIPDAVFLNFKEPRNRFQGKFRQPTVYRPAAGRYDNPISYLVPSPHRLL